MAETLTFRAGPVPSERSQPHVATRTATLIVVSPPGTEVCSLTIAEPSRSRPPALRSTTGA